MFWFLYPSFLVKCPINYKPVNTKVFNFYNIMLHCTCIWTLATSMEELFLVNALPYPSIIFNKLKEASKRQKQKRSTKFWLIHKFRWIHKTLSKLHKTADGSNEPSHEIMVLFVLRKLILQTRVRSHPLRLDVWLLWATREGPGETARMRRLAWAFADRLCDKYHNLMSFM